MKELPIGIQDFRKLREGNFLYVDKTKEIEKLTRGAGYYFLSRPRRFGKSVLLSAMKYLFQGKRELFNGLSITDKWDWEKTNPVVHISFSSIGHHKLGLEKAIDLTLTKIGDQHGITLANTSIDQKLKKLLEELYNQEGEVVILIDEYDKPLIDYLGDNLEQALSNQKILKTFYSIIKDCDTYIRLLFITGVSKFSKVGIFSDLNNLRDLTTSRKFSTICGYTEEELHHYFTEYAEEEPTPQFWEKVRNWYNGYSWDAKTYVYNPFSVLNYFAEGEFNNYWFETGTPTFLIQLLKKEFYYDFNRVRTGKIGFNSYNIEELEPLPLLFQTGYLTIKHKDDRNIYTLGYPNDEVKESMLEHLIGAFRHGGVTRSHPIVMDLTDAFKNDDIENVISIINTLFASIPNQIFINKKEAYFHSVVYLAFQFLGQYIDAEVNTASGRIDAVLQTNTHIYVIEFKLDKGAKEAIQQIKDKGYADKYQHSKKIVKLLGISFGSKEKKVVEWLLE